MPKPSPAHDLARDCANLYAELRRAAGVLHDDIGSLLAVAGLRLQLLCMDFPEASARAAEASQAIEGAMEHVRKLSRDLEPSPVRRTGLKNAVLDLAEVFSDVTVRYTATAALAPLAADALYRAIASTVAAASVEPGVTGIAVSVSGSRSVTARVVYDSRRRNAERVLAAAALLGQHSGLSFEMKENPGTKRMEAQRVKTEKGTIVTIQYAGRRSAGG